MGGARFGGWEKSVEGEPGRSAGSSSSVSLGDSSEAVGRRGGELTMSSSSK